MNEFAYDRPDVEADQDVVMECVNGGRGTEIKLNLTLHFLCSYGLMMMREPEFIISECKTSRKMYIENIMSPHKLGSYNIFSCTP